MVANQGCKKCRTTFNENSHERNYTNYKKFGFKTEEKFRKHNSGNKNCPCKKVNNISDTLQNCQPLRIQERIPKWKSPILNSKLITNDDYVDSQEINEIKLKRHNRGGRQLWFPPTEEAALDILIAILNNEIQWITLVAEPGSGKTMVCHLLTYTIFKLPYDKSIHTNSITITTGMADKEWYNQMIKNFKLRDGEYLWKEIHKVNDNNCIVHRSNFHKRITYLLNNQEYLANHIFIIDESHFADDELMTIDNEFRRLGLNEERMKEYNIKVLFISATPDVNLSIMNRQDNHKLVQLKNGSDYKGFEYHYNAKRIVDDSTLSELDSYIRSNYSEPRYHYIRARTQQEKGNWRKYISDCCAKNGFTLIEDDSENNTYISFKNDNYEKNAELEGKRIIKTYLRPNDHTVILIKNKYTASKRLKITRYTGIILEKKSNKRNATVTCNGLIPRFFGYDEWPVFNSNEEPIFICDEQSVKEYIEFSKNFIYLGKDYTGSRIKSDKKKTKELKNTCYGSLANITPITNDNEIYIDGPFDPDKDIQNYLLQERGFEEAGINVRDNCGGNKGNDGYMYPKRKVPGHEMNIPGNTFLTEEIYNLKYVNKGGGSFINKRPKEAHGQSFMIYPVYKNSESEPNDFKYYVHSLIVK